MRFQAKSREIRLVSWSPSRPGAGLCAHKLSALAKAGCVCACVCVCVCACVCEETETPRHLWAGNLPKRLAGMGPLEGKQLPPPTAAGPLAGIDLQQLLPPPFLSLSTSSPTSLGGLFAEMTQTNP